MGEGIVVNSITLYINLVLRNSSPQLDTSGIDV